MKTSVVESILLLVLGVVLFAEEPFDEDELFQDEDSVLRSSGEFERAPIDDQPTGLNVSGDVLYRSVFRVPRDWLDDDSESTFLHYGQVDLLADLRLERGLRVFGSSSFLLDIAYRDLSGVGSSVSPTSGVVLNEFFVDANLAYAAYFRLGKQRLKWGRGFFWNPADLVDLDRKLVSDLSRRRQGRPGLRLFVPFGARFNVVGFVALSDDDLQDASWAFKVEGFVGATELALSAWVKPRRAPIAAAEVSTGLFGLQWVGEAALSAKTFDLRPVREGGTWSLRRLDEFSYRAVVGANRTFGAGNNKILGTEWFTNSEGFDGANALDDGDLLRVLEARPLPSLAFSALYGSVYFGWAELFAKTTSIRCHLVANLVDRSFVVGVPVEWVPVYQMVVVLGLNVYLGSGGGEFTQDALGVGVHFDVKASF